MSSASRLLSRRDEFGLVFYASRSGNAGVMDRLVGPHVAVCWPRVRVYRTKYFGAANTSVMVVGILQRHHIVLSPRRAALGKRHEPTAVVAFSGGVAHFGGPITNSPPLD